MLNCGDRDMWKQLQTIVPHKNKSKSTVPGSPSLANELNKFYSRFDREPSVPDFVHDTDTSPHTVSESDTRLVLSRLQERKAAGPDGISPRLLKNCCHELSAILTFIFNWSLRISTVPHVFKKSIIIPVPKRTPVSSLNDYRPAALTSIIISIYRSIPVRTSREPFCRRCGFYHTA